MKLNILAKGEKKMSFMNDLKTTLNENSFSVTENGALGFNTSGAKLLDLNFAVTSFRNKSDKAIEDAFAKAFYENKLLAVKWLFYCRDAREGIGERRLFRICLKWLAAEQSEIAKAVFGLAPYYGRYDDMWCLLDTELKNDVIAYVSMQLDEDLENMKANKPVSLLAKWLPSMNASSRETKRLAKIIYAGLGMKERNYRKTLSALRKYLRVVEVQMSAKKWSEIDYNAVPSRANLIYNGAFLRNDEERRRAYLAALERGDEGVKINSSVNFPHDIVHSYMTGSGYGQHLKSGVDTTLEQLWKALPDFVNGQGNTICVADGSGSMKSTVGGTNVTCLDVANALAIYFAEHSNGEFKNNYITFSHRPQLVDFSQAKTLREKIAIALRYNEMANTNIEAVFDLLLKTAVSKKMSQEDIPTNVLILSDMEFDSCARDNSGGWGVKNTLFREIEKKWTNAGYKMPRVVFWNICSRTGTLPVNQHENFPVALVSGFSPAICKMVLSGKLDPFECLVEQLNSERYQMVEGAVKDIV